MTLKPATVSQTSSRPSSSFLDADVSQSQHHGAANQPEDANQASLDGTGPYVILEPRQPQLDGIQEGTDPIMMHSGPLVNSGSPTSPVYSDAHKSLPSLPLHEVTPAPMAPPLVVPDKPVSAPQDQQAGRRMGAWINGLINNQDSKSIRNTPPASINSSREDADSTYSFSTIASNTSSPSKLRKKHNTSSYTRNSIDATIRPETPNSQASTSQPALRMGGLDRFLDRAVQYFTDSDSNVDQCPDDIWLLGVRHDGYRPEPAVGDMSERRSSASGPSSSSAPSAPQACRSPRLPRIKRNGFGKGREGRRGSKTSLGEASDQNESPRSSSSTIPEASTSRPATLQPFASPPRSKSAAFFSAFKSSNTMNSIAQYSLPEGTSRSPSKLLGRASSSNSSISASSQTMSRLSSSSSAGSSQSISTPRISSTSDASLNTLPTLAETNGWPPSFYLDFYSRIQLTYRSSFLPIPTAQNSSGSLSPTNAVSGAWNSMLNGLSASIGRGSPATPKENGLTSDTGWGCMLRTGQSLLANALVHAHLGRDWRHPLAERAEALRDRPDYHTYVRLISWFLDDPSALAAFSIHRFAAEGQRLGKQVGEWFGPSTAAGAIKSLANSFEPANLGVALAIETTIYRSEVFSIASDGGPDGLWNRPVLILVPLRLGLNNGVNPIYFKSIKHYFTLPQCVGIAGGRPSSSYYFVGTQNDNLFYIDPHHTKPSVQKVTVPDELRHQAEHAPLQSSESKAAKELEGFFTSAYSPQELLSFHCEKVRKMSLTGLDPSMLVGLLCKTRADWDDLCVRMKEFGSAKGAQPIIHIVQEMPAWMRNPSRTLSSTGRPADAVRDVKLSQLSEGGPLNLQRTISREDADSVDYADSDDWDIEDSEGESNMGVESIGRQSSASASVPSGSLPKDYTRVEEPKERNDSTDDWQEMPQPSRTERKEVAGSPESLFFDRDAEAVVVPSTARTVSFPSTSISRLPEQEEKHEVAALSSKDSEDHFDDWQGVGLESQRTRQTSNDSGGTQRARTVSRENDI